MNLDVNITDLRHRVVFQKLDTNVQNEYGEPIEKWEDIKTVWSGIYPLSGKEFFAGETVNTEVTHKIKLRYTKGITPSMRIKFKDRYFSIISIINFQERNILLQIMARELI